ncbi:MAG: cyclic pyranopterin monophosphate synthase MoaC [Actinomycetota bacterium]|nr:cyclic pyranopterin monophosphate synthase MoaC [Actinomycetota bacterium]
MPRRQSTDAKARLTHLADDGSARMVDVSSKPVTARKATAEAFVRIDQATLALIRQGATSKGDVIAVARIAGIMAAKKTHELIPLCHPLAISGIEVDLDIEPDGIKICATVTTNDRTGVEMEALVAASVAGLTVYDMCKASDKSISIEKVRLLSKTGGKSGPFKAPR